MAPRDPSRKLALGKGAYSFTCSCLFAEFFSTFAILANIGHCEDCRLAVMLSVSVFRRVRLPSFCPLGRCLEMIRMDCDEGDPGRNNWRNNGIGNSTIKWRADLTRVRMAKLVGRLPRRPNPNAKRRNKIPAIRRRLNNPLAWLMGEENGNCSNDLKNQKIKSKSRSKSSSETENRKELNNHLGCCEFAFTATIADPSLPFVAWQEQADKL